MVTSARIAGIRLGKGGCDEGVRRELPTYTSARARSCRPSKSQVGGPHMSLVDNNASGACHTAPTNAARLSPPFLLHLARIVAARLPDVADSSMSSGIMPWPAPAPAEQNRQTGRGKGRAKPLDQNPFRFDCWQQSMRSTPLPMRMPICSHFISFVKASAGMVSTQVAVVLAFSGGKSVFCVSPYDLPEATRVNGPAFVQHGVQASLLQVLLQGAATRGSHPWT